MTKFWEYLTLPYVCNLAHLKLQSLGCQQKLQSQSYVKDDSAVFFSMIMFDWKPPSVLLLILGGLGKSSGTINRALIGLASSLAITRSSKQVAAKSRYKKGTVAVFFFSCLFQFFSRNFFSTDNNTIVQLFFSRVRWESTLTSELFFFFPVKEIEDRFFIGKTCYHSKATNDTSAVTTFYRTFSHGDLSGVQETDTWHHSFFSEQDDWVTFLRRRSKKKPGSQQSLNPGLLVLQDCALPQKQPPLSHLRRDGFFYQNTMH